MKRRSFSTGALALLAGGAVWHSSAVEPRHRKETTDPKGGVVVHQGDQSQVRQFRGNLTLDQAVDIALHQNPDLLKAIQDIERTRGLIIEVRAAALPHITITGDYEQQDKRLLKGGGETGGGATTPTTSLATSSVGTTSTQPTTQQTNAGFVGNTNTTGSGLVTGGTATPGGTTTTTGLAAARGERHTAAALVPAAGTAGAAANTNAATGANGSGTLDPSVLQQIQDSLGQSSNAGAIQNKSWNVTIEVRQALYTGGQVSAAIRIARFAQDSAYFQLRDTVDRIIAQVREQFYTVLLNRQLITVAEEAVKLAEDQLRDQQNRFEAGTVPRFNVLRAEVQVANEQPVLIRARGDFLLAKVQLSKSLGLDPGPSGRPEFNCVGELAVSDRHISLPDSLALARARRPFLKVQRLNILIDVEQVTVELAGYKPRLDGHAGYELRNRNSSEDISDTVNGWFFGVTGSWNVFDGFQTYGRVKEARARLEQSKINYDDSVREVDLEVQTAYVNLQQARETIVSQRKNVEQAAEALRLAQERFSAGAGTQLEILDATVALTQARTTELQARTDFNRDLAEFDRATATITRWHEYFKDPMMKVEKGIFARLAETGLPKFSGSVAPK